MKLFDLISLAALATQAIAIPSSLPSQHETIISKIEPRILGSGNSAGNPDPRKWTYGRNVNRNARLRPKLDKAWENILMLYELAPQLLKDEQMRKQVSWYLPEINDLKLFSKWFQMLADKDPKQAKISWPKFTINLSSPTDKEKRLEPTIDKSADGVYDITLDWFYSELPHITDLNDKGGLNQALFIEAFFLRAIMITDSFKNSLQGQLQKAHVKEYPDRDKKSPHIEMHDVVHDRWYGLPAITAFRAQQIAKHPTDEAIEASVWNNYTPQFILQDLFYLHRNPEAHIRQASIKDDKGLANLEERGARFDSEIDIKWN